MPTSTVNSWPQNVNLSEFHIVFFCQKHHLIRIESLRYPKPRRAGKMPDIQGMCPVTEITGVVLFAKWNLLTESARKEAATCLTHLSPPLLENDRFLAIELDYLDAHATKILEAFIAGGTVNNDDCWLEGVSHSLEAIFE